MVHLKSSKDFGCVLPKLSLLELSNVEEGEVGGLLALTCALNGALNGAFKVGQGLCLRPPQVIFTGAFKR